MTCYKKISYWENKKRIEELKKFEELIVDYFNNIEYISFLSVKENQKAVQTRLQINLCLDKIYSYIIATGVNPTIYYCSPPAIGGFAGNIDLMNNIFNLHKFRIPPQDLIDVVDRSIGIYHNDTTSALIKTFNPFFWIGKLIDFIVEIPFRFMGKVGFNRKKIESSIIGKTVKGILYLITVGASFLTILEKLNYLDTFKAWLMNLIK